MRLRVKTPKCPTCGSPLPTTPDPSNHPDVNREILRRLTTLELFVKQQIEASENDGPRAGGGGVLDDPQIMSRPPHGFGFDGTTG